MYLWPDSESPFCTLTVTMDFDDAAINHGIFHIRLTADFLKHSGKAPCFAPAAVTLEHAVPFAKFLGQIPPRAARMGSLPYIKN